MQGFVGMEEIQDRSGLILDTLKLRGHRLFADKMLQGCLSATVTLSATAESASTIIRSRSTPPVFQS